jgi:hypothetical protein
VRDFVGSLGLKVEGNDRKIIAPQELDIIIPEKKIAIEYCGLYWHSVVYLPNNYHYKKYKATEAADWRLITIFEDEWNFRKEQVKGFLESVLAKPKRRLYARQCTVEEIDRKTAKEFINKYHIQQLYSLDKAVGLFYNKELVGVMSFAKHHRQNNPALVLQRMCFKRGVQIVGGASKLFKKGRSLYPEAEQVVSWSDNRWSQGNVYEKLGFKCETEYRQDYSYVDKDWPKKRYSKQSKKKQATGCPPERTEKEFCETELGLVRIYDCGKKKWVFECQN